MGRQGIRAGGVAGLALACALALGPAAAEDGHHAPASPGGTELAPAPAEAVVMPAAVIGNVVGETVLRPHGELDATDPPPEGADVNDPLESFNRYMFAVNDLIDGVVLRPLAEAYRFLVPEYGRDRIRNALDNLDTPVILVNDLFQGEFERAGTTAARFGINTTIGLAGLYDPAEGWGLARHTEDFGQTLGVYGLGEGPYLFVPIFGPLPPRDLVGRIVDTASDPFTWIGGDRFQYVKYGRTVLNGLDIRARNIESIDELERTSIDYYAAVRSLYRQSRAGAIRNGEIDFDTYELPDAAEPAAKPR